MYQIKNIHFSYGKQTIFNNAEYRFALNSINVIAGPSGCGKSTLLKILSNNLNCKYQTDQESIFNSSKNELIKYICYHHLETLYFENLKIIENLNMMKESFNSPLDVDALLIKFKLMNKKSSYPSKLSGGEKQIVNVIMHLLENKPILFLDEPTSSLNLDMKTSLLEALKEYVSEGHTIIIATNDQFIIENGDYISYIHDYKIDNQPFDNRSDIIKKKEFNQINYLKSHINKKPYWLLICILLISLSIGYMYSKQVYNNSYSSWINNKVIERLDLSSKDIITAYYPNESTSRAYFGWNKSLENEMFEEMSNIPGIKSVYPFYFLPLSYMGMDAMNTYPYVDNYIFSIGNKQINLSNSQVALAYFYFPEQNLGEGVLISKSFIEENQLDNVIHSVVKMDALIPIETKESSILSGEDLDEYISTERIYEKKTLELEIDGVVESNDIIGFNQQPIIYIPFNDVDLYIDRDLVKSNKAILFFNSVDDIDLLKDEIRKIDQNLTVRYPAFDNMEIYEDYKKSLNNNLLSAFIHAFIYAVLLATALLGIEVFFNRKDGILYIELGINKKDIIKEKMKPLITIYSLILIEVIVFNFMNLKTLTVPVLVGMSLFFVVASVLMMRIGLEVVYGNSSN